MSKKKQGAPGGLPQSAAERDYLIQNLARVETTLKNILGTQGSSTGELQREISQVLDQAQLALKDTGQMLEQVLGSTYFGVAYLDRDCNYRWVNPVFARIHAQEQAYFTGKNHFMLFPDPQAETIFKQVLATAEPQYIMGTPSILPDRQVSQMTSWNWSVQPVRQDGEVVGILLSADVNEQRRADLAAFENQALFAQLFESLPDASLLIQEDGTILVINRQAEILFGYDSGQIVGMNIEALIQEGGQPESGNDRFYHLQPRFFAGTSGELTGVRKNQRKFPVELTLNPISLSGRSLIICVARDITRRLRAEQALKQQSDFVRLLQDVAVAANEAQTVEGALQFALDRICEFTGWPVGHAIQKDPQGGLVSTGLWHLDNQEKRAVFQQVSETMRWTQDTGGLLYRVLITGQSNWIADIMDDPDFRRKEEAHRAGLRSNFSFPILIGKEVSGMLEFFAETQTSPQDDLLQIMVHIGTQLGRVMERERSRLALQRSEARFRAIFEESIIGIQVIDQDGRFVDSNPATQTMLGYTPEELHNFTQTELLYPEDAARNWEFFKSLLRGERSHYVLETRYQCKDGSLMWAHQTMSVMEQHDSQPQLFVGLTVDISARKEMEAELEEVQDRLQDSAEAERLRLAMELHDGPLQDLYGAIFQIQEIVPNLTDTNTLTGARNAQSIVQQVISTLRSMVGDLRPPTLIPFGLEKAIRSHITHWRQIYPNLTIHLDLMSDGNSLAPSVRLALFRAYQQLISNVARHSNASNIWLRLRMLKDEVALEVQDDGDGFNLPERWVELAREGHTGLLGISERMDAFGGGLWVETSPGAGTLVRVSLPYQRVTNQSPPGSSPSSGTTT